MEKNIQKSPLIMVVHEIMFSNFREPNSEMVG